MSAHAVLEELSRLGCEVEVNGDRLTISPASRLTDDLRAEIRERKPEIIATLRPMPASLAERCPTCGEPTRSELVRERHLHVYCLVPGHYDAWATTDGERFGDLALSLAERRGGEGR